MLADGKAMAAEILAEVRSSAAGKKLRLVGVLVGNNQNSWKFLELKQKAAEKVGIAFRLYKYPETMTSKELRAKLVELGRAELNNGITVELPLPNRINTQPVLNAIPEAKDVDVLSQKMQGVFYTDRSSILPPAVAAVKVIFEKNEIKLPDKICAVFGYGLLVGKPISHWLAAQGATVTVITENTANPGEISRMADIIVTGVGQNNLITAAMVREGAVVIDFGGDVDFPAVRSHCSLITPPTGGVGPIVVAAVLKNLALLQTPA